MWNYEKRLEYPVNITRCDPKAAMVIISQYGGPDGEIGASMRYLSQRYSMENRIAAGTLTDIGVSVGKLRKGVCPGKWGFWGVKDSDRFLFVDVLKIYLKNIK